MSNRYILILGDLLTLGAITLIGFGTHGETGPSYLPRMAATFFPISMAWFLLAPFFGLYQIEIVQNARQLWRPALVMLYTGPLAALLRGIILYSPVVPIFIIVLTVTSALGMIFWRAVYYLLNRQAG